MGKVQLTGEKDEWKSLCVESHTKKISETVDKIKEDFLYIGFLLWEVKEYEYYKMKGYSSIVEYAEKEFNFKKASTYNFISVCLKFCQRNNGYPTFCIDKQYSDFNFTQLCEILPLSDTEINSINPDMSISDIRVKKKELKQDLKKELKEQNIIDVEYEKDQVLLIENQIVILDPVVTENIDLVKSEPSLKKDIINLIENQTISIDEPVPVGLIKVSIMEYLNSRIRELRKSAENTNKVIEKCKFFARLDEVETLSDFIGHEDRDFFNLSK